MNPADCYSRWLRHGKTVLAVAGPWLLTAGLLAMAQTVAGCGWLIFFGFSPLCLTLRPQRFVSTWLSLAVVYGLYNVLTTSWVAYFDGGRWLPVTLVLMPLYSAILVLLPALGCRTVHSSTSPVAPLLILPAAWVLMEILERHVMLHVSWALVGQPLAQWPALAQSAALLGPESISFFPVAIGVAIAIAFRSRSRGLSLLGLLQGPGLALVVFCWGAIRLNDTAENARTLRAGLIQPNVPAARQWDPAYRRSMLAHFDRLIDRVMAQNPDIIVLPESAVSGLVTYDRDLADWVKGTVIRTRRPLLFGGLDRDLDPSQDSLYNAAFLVTPYGTVTVYRKIHLVPLAEHTPEWGPLQALLRRLTQGESVQLTPGLDRTIFRLKEGIQFGTLICYEDVFPELGRESASAGTDLLIVLVNTTQFRDSSQAWQHLRRAQLTAISVGMPMVRCANSGISGVIGPDGRILSLIPKDGGELLMVEGAGVLSVPLATIVTPYRRFGDSLPLTCLGLLTAASVGWSHLRRPFNIRRRRGPIPIWVLFPPGQAHHRLPRRVP
jgi:apolipoprotein N-acyltransferase